ncbi:hypothetical protein [Thermaerobacillus caldiproteolyticus]|uniref:hypothetical protein n=1 Tax=Thermaerobacillus caldiproteolyticus TaxID=247480 RepID=UPI00188B1792|nr:hypothetical protein [Anoxybacillus caldiproteolyticus]QPA33407.1 hypothetical protein ISX45_18980 [Anoxybacillus caldiproteolyticus]
MEHLQQEQQPVYVRTPLFEGLAVIDYVGDIKEMFPVQVVLQEPDEDGHRLKRVVLAELYLPENIEIHGHQVQEDDTRPLFTGTNDKTRYLVEAVHEHSPYRVFKGEKYIVGPTRDNCDQTFFVYELDHTWMGRYRREWFQILSVYDDSKSECVPTFPKPKTKANKSKTKKETAAKSSEPVRFEQLSFELF